MAEGTEVTDPTPLSSYLAGKRRAQDRCQDLETWPTQTNGLAVGGIGDDSEVSLWVMELWCAINNWVQWVDPVGRGNALRWSVSRPSQIPQMST